jgi:cellulose synthase/poly-beta-1,6-N-acetylglucosamine synthase-like glycosyltransferase
MPGIENTITYILLFISLNFEMFLLITYFESRFQIKEEEKRIITGVKKYPEVTIIVPCWNEENTVSGTVYSLLNLDYPKNKLKIMIVDDGSTDNTWQIIQKFKNNPQIEIYTKENGGKYTALNFGLEKLDTELFGCLDADSYVSKDALKTIVTYFEDKETMAVAPSIKLWKPKGVLQMLQRVEYGFGIFTRKMFHYMHAIYITPGPFSIFRKEVFEKIGGYEHAHNTEDINIALRMQKNHLKIAHAHNAVVYTIPPTGIKALLKQRIRWTYGFINNAIDFRDMFFKKEYGNVGLFVLPMAGISLLSVMAGAGISIINIISKLAKTYVRIETVGWNWNWHFNFDWFYVNTEIMALVTIITFIGTVSMVLASRKLSEGKIFLGLDLIYYFTLYIFIAPIWIAKALFNTIFKVQASWR